MAVNLSFIGGAGWQFLDNSGNPLSGGKVYTYAAGTTTPLTTYTDRTGVTPNANPIILDSAGRTPSQIWSTEGLLYKYVVATSTDVILRTWDNIGGSEVASDLAVDLAAPTGATLIGTDTGATLQARLDQLAVKTYDANGLGVVIGDTSYSASAIGAGTIIMGGWTAAPNDNRLSGAATNLRAILGGYDNEIGASLASVIVGSHHSTISTGVTHGSIFGGSFNDILAGDYGTIGGGTGNVNSGSSSTISGGTSNTIGAGATSSTVGGGSTNSISAGVLRGTIAGGIQNQVTGGSNGAIGGGQGNVLSGGNSFAAGQTNTISGVASFVFGLSNTVTSLYSGAWGRSNTVSKDYGGAYGYQAVARTTGRTAAGGQIAAAGDAQYTDIPIKGVTTSNTNVYLTGADANQLVIPFPADNFAATVSALITAVEPATGDSKSLRVDALVKRIGGVNTLVGGAATITVIAADAGAAAWAITAFSLSGNSMRIGVGGDIGKTIRWSGKVTAVEVSF